MSDSEETENDDRWDAIPPYCYDAHESNAYAAGYSAAIAVFRKEQKRQATDREAKAAAFDEYMNLLVERPPAEMYAGRRIAAELASCFQRQRLNVNPNLVSRPLCWCGKDNQTHHAEETDHKFEPPRDGDAANGF